MKRITWWPQAWLGLVFSWGALVGWPAVTGSLRWPPLLLWLGSIFWVIGYDTLYAIQDIEDDALVGVKSSARRLGDKAPLGIAIFYALALLLWGAAIWIGAAGLAGAAGAAPGRAPPRQPGAARRPERRRARAEAVPLQPHLRLACLPRDAGRRPFRALGAPPCFHPTKPADIAESLVERGIAAGADAADALYVGERSSGVQVRLGELEHVSRSEGRGDRGQAVRRPALGDRRLVRSVGRGARRCWSTAAWRWRSEAPEDPYAGLAPRGAADARRAAVPRFARTSASLTPPSFAPGRWKRRMRRSRSPA